MTALLSRACRLTSGALRRRINTTRAKSTTATTTTAAATATSTAARAVPASIPLDAHTGGATVVSGDGATHVTTLGNGLRVVSERSPGHFAALGVYVDAGSRYEGAATAGFGHLLDRLAFRSSAR
ncbi:Mitochondrial-processing peptidase subunit alpha, partial [Kickxella alabastrina]